MTIAPVMATAINLRRPKRIAASLPKTLAKVPSRPRAVSTMVGDNTFDVVPVWLATNPRNATPQPRIAFISSV